MLQTVCTAQELFAKACLVNHPELAGAQERCDLVKAESFLQDAFATDVRPAIQEWRRSKGVPLNPLDAFRQSGYLERITQQRSARNSQSVSSYA
jgi:L-rhamnose isomerase/sugar isomerase